MSSGTGSFRRKSSHNRDMEKSNKFSILDEEQLKMEETKTKQNILRKLGRKCLKDVDFEQLVINNVLCLAISD
jgi:hypothetical protein